MILNNTLAVRMQIISKPGNAQYVIDIPFYNEEKRFLFMRWTEMSDLRLKCKEDIKTTLQVLRSYYQNHLSKKFILKLRYAIFERKKTG